MTVTPRGRFSLILLACALGCGGKKPAESPQGTAAEPEKKVAAAVKPAPAPLPPLTPAAAPKGVFARARVKSIGRLVEGALRAGDLKNELGITPETLAEELGALTEIFDWNGTIEAAVFLDRKPKDEPHAIYSFGVKNIDGAVSFLEREGTAVLEGRGGNYYFHHEGQDCVLGRALGSSPGRVVCGSDEEALTEGAAYALTGLPLEPLADSEVHAEVDIRVLMKVYGPELKKYRSYIPAGLAAMSSGEPKLDSAMKRLVYALFDEAVDLGEDSSTFAFDVFESSGNFRLEWSGDFHEKKSWTLGAFDELRIKSGPPPAAFSELPRNVSMATYSYGLSEHRLTEWRRTFGDLAEGFAKKNKASAVLQKRLRAVTEDLFQPKEWSVSAQGPTVERATKDGKKALSPAWNLYALSGPKKEVVGLYDGLAQLTGSKDFWKLFEQDSVLFQFKKDTAKLRGVTGATLYRWEFPTSGQNQLSDVLGDLPSEARGAFDADILSFLLQNYAKGYLAVVERNGVTWISSGPDVDAAAEPLRQLADKNSSRLGTAPEVAALLSTKAASQAFVKLDGVVGYAGPLFAAETKELLFDQTKLPHRGEVPVLSRLVVERGKSFKVRFIIEVPQAFSADAVSLAKEAFAGALDAAN